MSSKYVSIETEVMTTMTAWPDKEPGDAEWVYVAIAKARIRRP